MTSPASTEEAMKPCPFCGGTNTHMQANGRVWLGTRYGEPASVSVVHWCEQTPGQPSRRIERVGRDEESAIAAWNRRALDESRAAAALAADALDAKLTDAYAEGRRDEQYELASVLPGTTYMDPPDGGAPTILEQLQRQAKDAQRYLWLRGRLLAADFAWGDPPQPVLVFAWPADVGVGGNCDMNIDAAIQSTHQPQGEGEAK